MIVSANAEGVSIKNIEIIEKSEHTTELKPPTHEGLEVYFHVKFQELNDKAKYKILIENASNNKYEITTKDSFGGRDYTTYTYHFEEEGNIVLPNTTKTMYVEVSYSKEVPDNQYVNGKYHEDNEFIIMVDTISQSLEPTTPVDPSPVTPETPEPTDPEEPATPETPANPEDKEPTETPKQEAPPKEEIENPSTGTNFPWITLISAFIVGVGIYLAVQKKLPLRKLSVFFIALGISLPLFTSAVEQLYVKVHVNIEIEKPQLEEKTFTVDCIYGKEYHFEEGMTWEEFIASKYNVDNWKISEDEYFGYRYKISLTEDNEYGEAIYPDDDVIVANDYYCEEPFLGGNECCFYFETYGDICTDDEAICNLEIDKVNRCCSVDEWGSIDCDYECIQSP